MKRWILGIIKMYFVVIAILAAVAGLLILGGHLLKNADSSTSMILFVFASVIGIGAAMFTMIIVLSLIFGVVGGLIKKNDRKQKPGNKDGWVW